jgi:hypothetical protein
MGAFEFTTKLSEQFNLVLGMARPLDDGDHTDDSIEDLYYLHLPVETNKFSITPHALFSRAGKDVTDSGVDSTGMWLGVALEMDMDPVEFKSDLYYGKRSDFIAEDADESGYFFDASLSYKMDAFTPQIFGIYSSGEDDDGDESERLPSYDDELEPYNIYGDAAGSTASGIATVALALNDISFINKLEHSIIGGYIVGTNDKNSGVDIHESELTEDDSLVEIDFNSKYEILKDKMHLDSLDLILDFGYAMPDFENIDPDNAYYAEFGFEAEF